VELVGVQDHLIESRVPESQRLAFFDPGGGRLGCRDIDLVFARRRDNRRQAAKNVLFFQLVDQAGVPFGGTR
jgi:hypothetical protein